MNVGWGTNYLEECSHTYLVRGSYTEYIKSLFQLSDKKKSAQEKWVKDLNCKNAWVASKLRKRCLVSPAIRDMQIKIMGDKHRTLK